MSNSWDDKKKEIEDLIATPGILLSDLMPYSPAKITQSFEDEIIRQFTRLGYLECIKWVVKESDDPCILTQFHNGDKHVANISLSAKQINSIANSFSTSMTSEIGATIGSKISSSAGLPGAGNVSAEVSAELSKSDSMSEVSTTSIASQIESALSQSETVELSGHVRSRCKALSVPYGLELVVSISGSMSLERYWWQDRNNPHQIVFSDKIIPRLSDIKLESSVDPKLKEPGALRDTSCAKCPDGKHLSLLDDGSTTLIDPEEKEQQKKPKSPK